MTTFPFPSSSRMRTGRTSTIRACECASSVMIPLWLPVKLIAGTPCSCNAMERRAMLIRSPHVRSMSSSRRGGSEDIRLARERSSSVVSPMAETTTTIWCPSARLAATRAATLRMRSTSATEEPPNVGTMSMHPPGHGKNPCAPRVDRPVPSHSIARPLARNDSPMTAMIEVTGLTKRYRDRVAVEDLSFSVPEGEILGFLGPNGAGKSTTMRILTGYLPATGGTVKVAGFDVFEDPYEVKRRIGYLPETPPLYPEMTVRGYLKFVAAIKGVRRGQLAAELERVAHSTGVAEVMERLIQNLSKGYRQRVGVAQALLGNPPVLILDEPTEGLDPSQRAEVRQLIKGLAGQHTVILSTHILSEVTMTCERVLILNQGRMVAFDEIRNLSLIH